MLKSSVQHKILKTLPDDRPITAIQIVENIEKCPRGFYPVSRTYDQDQDADLRESSIFKSSSARYLCFSKTEGLPNFVIQDLVVAPINSSIPRSFSLLSRTADSDSKAWRKKQLCYRLVNLKDTSVAITDIILCSRLKKAPNGFSLAGELNGVIICYKMGNVQDTQSNPDNDTNGNNGNGIPPVRPPRTSGGAPTSPGVMYPSLGGDADHDYEILRPPYPVAPMRPAPRPPTTPPASLSHQNSTQTLGYNTHTLDGVPFIINPKFITKSSAEKFQFPVIKAKTMQQIMKEYDYPFKVEKQALT